MCFLFILLLLLARLFYLVFFLAAYFLKQEKKMAWSWVDGKVGSLLEESGEGKRMFRIYFMKKFNKNKLVRPVGDSTCL